MKILLPLIPYGSYSCRNLYMLNNVRIFLFYALSQGTNNIHKVSTQNFKDIFVHTICIHLILWRNTWNMQNVYWLVDRIIWPRCIDRVVFRILDNFLSVIQQEHGKKYKTTINTDGVQTSSKGRCRWEEHTTWNRGRKKNKIK